MESINERKAFRLSVIIVLLIAVIACMIISLIWGSTPVSLAEIWRTLWSNELTDTASQIIWNIRLPRNIVAALVGACLAVSGAILQAVMKNPLADPQIVGVSSGAGLAGVIIFILFPGYDHILKSCNKIIRKVDEKTLSLQRAMAPTRAINESTIGAAGAGDEV